MFIALNTVLSLGAYGMGVYAALTGKDEFVIDFLQWGTIFYILARLEGKE